jgi:hypothetical protein
MSKNMIERIAGAIKNAMGLDGVYTEHEELLAYARAAIEAMRLPQGASSVPGGLAIEESMFASEDTVFHGAAKCWNAILDAALNQTDSEDGK